MTAWRSCGKGWTSSPAAAWSRVSPLREMQRGQISWITSLTGMTTPTHSHLRSPHPKITPFLSLSLSLSWADTCTEDNVPSPKITAAQVYRELMRPHPSKTIGPDGVPHNCWRPTCWSWEILYSASSAWALNRGGSLGCVKQPALSQSQRNHVLESWLTSGFRPWQYTYLSKGNVM